MKRGLLGWAKARPSYSNGNGGERGMRWRRWRTWRWLAQFMVGALTLQWVGRIGAQERAETLKAPPRMIVLDFEVPKEQPELLGRKAADAVAVALVDIAKYEVIPRTDVEAALQRLRLTPPLTTHQITLLAKNLNARYVVVGKVVRVVVDAKAGRASVQLQMLYQDPYLEAPVNGAHVLATTPPRVGATPDILVDQALNLAAQQAVQQALATRLPEGQIMQRAGNTVIINRGHDQGLRDGMRMWVYRLVRDPETGQWVRTRIGRITITSAEARQSSAVIDEELVPIQYPDRVIGIYEIPKLGVPEPPVQRKVKGAGAALPQLLLLIAGIVLVGSLAGSSKRGTGTPSIASAQVVNNGQNVRLRFKGDKNDLLIEIYRDTAPLVRTDGVYPIEIFEAQVASEYVDGNYTLSGTVTIENIEPVTGGTPTPFFPPVTRSLGDVGDTFTRDRFNYEVSFLHQPLIPGQHYWYAIRKVVVQRLAPPPPTAGQATEREPFQLVYSRVSQPLGPLTPLVQLTEADLLEPTGDVNITDVTFRFLSAQGADEYVVQVSDRPDFPPNRIAELPLPNKVSNPDIGGQPLVLANQNLALRLAAKGISITAGQVLYWRVGYRYSRDISPPEGGWVVSRVRSFNVVVAPPSPPGS